MKTTNYKKLTNIQKKLLDSAEKATKNAYNPYSHFYAGAAILTEDNKIITGSNIANAAYNTSVCAERGALLRAYTKVHRKLKSIALIAKGKDVNKKEITSPCGTCRQMLFEACEVSGNDIEVIMSSPDKDKIVVSTIKELLPLAFGPKKLGIDMK